MNRFAKISIGCFVMASAISSAMWIWIAFFEPLSDTPTSDIVFIIIKTLAITWGFVAFAAYWIFKKFMKKE